MHWAGGQVQMYFFPLLPGELSNLTDACFLAGVCAGREGSLHSLGRILEPVFLGRRRLRRTSTSRSSDADVKPGKKS